MRTTADLVAVLKKELKTARMTYADLALAPGMAASSVKRMLARGDMRSASASSNSSHSAATGSSWPRPCAGARMAR